MPCLIVFDTGLSLTVDEDVDKVRKATNETMDGFAQVHTGNKPAIISVSDVKFVVPADDEGGWDFSGRS